MAITGAGVASLQARANVVRFSAWAVVILLVPIVFFYGLLLVGQLGYGFPSPILIAIIGLAAALLYLALLVSGIATLAWIHRAHANLHDAGLEGLNYSPLWATLCWLVPFANLVVPMTSMRELWNRSHGAEEWHAGSAVGDITTWWTCHVTAMLILTFTSITASIGMIPGVYVTTPPAADTGLNIAAYLLMAVSALMLIRIVRTITQAQAHGLSSAKVFE